MPLRKQIADKAPSEAGIRYNVGKHRKRLPIGVSADLLARINAAAMAAGETRSRWIVNILEKEFAK